jgi:hypothetical protein
MLHPDPVPAGGEGRATDPRLRYPRLGDAWLEIDYETHMATGWRRIDPLTCRRDPS